MGSYSTVLFAMPNVVSGLARTLDLGATFDSYNESLTDTEADIRALRADWLAVGEDLRVATRNWLADNGVATPKD